MHAYQLTIWRSYPPPSAALVFGVQMRDCLGRTPGKSADPSIGGGRPNPGTWMYISTWIGSATPPPRLSLFIYTVEHAICTGLAELSPSPSVVGYMGEQSYLTSLGIVYTMCRIGGATPHPRVGRATQPSRIHAWGTNSKALRQSGPAICLPATRSKNADQTGRKPSYDEANANKYAYTVVRCYACLMMTCHGKYRKYQHFV